MGQNDTVALAATDFVRLEQLLSRQKQCSESVRLGSAPISFH